jgi:hypothetical protein
MHAVLVLFLHVTRAVVLYAICASAVPLCDKLSYMQAVLVLLLYVTRAGLVLHAGCASAVPICEQSRTGPTCMLC